MTDRPLLAKVKDHRQEILWWEFCCLLHDIGKQSPEFLEYRQRWHAEPGGFAGGDPHDHEWLEKRDSLLKEEDFAPLRNFFTAERVEDCPRGTVSVENAIHNHIDPIDPKCKDPECRKADPGERKARPENLLLGFLKSADGLDARYDRNNPLLGCEQTDHSRSLEELKANPPAVFRGNVFGFEREVDPKSLEEERRRFYCELMALLKCGSSPSQPQWALLSESISGEFTYDKTFRPIRRLMETSWDNAMSDTTRPNNDTSLWEHVYSVSTISKALHAEYLMKEKHPTRDPQFLIVGIGFDSFHVLSSAHKIGDVVGRSSVIDAIFDECICVLEYEFPVGNHIYRDQDCLFFLVADCDELAREWEAQAVKICVQQSGGDMFPHFVHKTTRTLTVLPALMEEMRASFAIPVTVNPTPFLEALQQSRAPGTVCPICRLRRVERPPTELERVPVCKVCMDRRAEAGRQRHPDQSVYMTEIADRNHRVALLQVRVGLRDWLNGKLIRTTFVTEPSGAEKTLRAVKERRFVDLQIDDLLGAWLDRHMATPMSFRAMKEEFDGIASIERMFTGDRGVDAEIEEKLDKLFPHLLFGRGIGQKDENRPNLFVRQGSLRLADWRRDLEGQPGFSDEPSDEDLFNSLCAKTPTPSTLLDVWRTTEEFLEKVAGPAVRDEGRGGTVPWLSGFLSKQPRYRVVLENSSPRDRAGAITARYQDAEFELVRVEGAQNSYWIIGAPDSAVTAIRAGTSFETTSGLLTVQGPAETVGDVYYPWRLISASPNRLLLLVPADSAIGLAKSIYDCFLERFAKVYGRLPIAISTLFFPDHMPMFSVLDAARRVERTMRIVQERYRAAMAFTPPAVLGQHLSLGKASTDSNSVEEDTFHSYMVVAETENGEDYIKTIEGSVIPFRRAQDRRALIRPNLYLWHWLGSSSARFELETKASQENRSYHHVVEIAELLRNTAPLRGDGSPAMLLDDLEPVLLAPWETLQKSGISDTAIRNVVNLYRLKSAAWKNMDRATGTGEPSILSELLRLIDILAAGMPAQAYATIRKLVGENQLEPFMQLHLHVLKHRLRKDNAVVQ